MDGIKPLKQPHILGTSDLSAEEIRTLLATAKTFRKPFLEKRKLQILSDRTIAQLFFEPSTRTRTSFETAIRRLGGNTLSFTGSQSSLKKGETFLDTAQNIQAMGPDGIVVRHASAGSPYILAKHLRLPIINAGDGFHEHPTQALLDVYTMEEKLGTVAGKRIVILGDIAHSRVARSNIHALKKLGASVAVCAPPTLLPPHPEVLGVDHAYRPEDLLADADVVMTLRIQLERQNRMQLPSLSEYTRFWGLDRERAKLLKKNVIIMHPGPINRGVELDNELADSPLSVILDQVTNGILVRMAVLSWAIEPERTLNWLNQEGHIA